MRICFPVEEDRGLESPIHEHFGSSPAFLVVELGSGSHQVRVNQNAHHAEGQCNPMRTLQGWPIDEVVVRRIGRSAMSVLEAAGFEVRVTRRDLVREVLEDAREGPLPLARDHGACDHGHHRCRS